MEGFPVKLNCMTVINISLMTVVAHIFSSNRQNMAKSACVNVNKNLLGLKKVNIPAILKFIFRSHL